MKKLLIVTDLDASLIGDDYLFTDAIPALSRLADLGYPVVFNSSKTLTELKVLASQLKLDTPLIAENGGIIAIPHSSPLNSHTLENEHRSWENKGSEQTLVIGLAREFILQHAHAARVEHDYQFSGFDDWSAEVVAAKTGLSLADAGMARQRHVSEPIIWQDTEQRWDEFHAAMKQHGIRALRGGRFIHLMGQADKADGLNAIRALYSKSDPQTQWTTVALGDSANDKAMLEAADIAVVIPHADGATRFQVRARHVIHARHPASKGWNDAIYDILASF